MRRAVVVLVAALVLVAGACGTSTTTASRPVVTVFATYRDPEARLFMADLGRWATAHGIDLRYTGSGDFAADLQERVTNADPPDIALVPQPGLVDSLYRDGKLPALSPSVAAAARTAYPREALAIGQVDGTQVGFPFRVNVKSLVWYRPSVLSSLGLRPPTTMAELDQLVQRIQAAGRTPWCMGIEAQRSTGWAATDWIEDLVVRDWGTDVYQGWIDGTVPFRDPRIEQAFTELRDLVLTPPRVDGGLSAVVSTQVQHSLDPLFTDPPGCVLSHQASFALGWMPPGTSFGPSGDVDFFVLPGVTDAPPPIVVGADLAVAFDHRPEVDEVMTELTRPEAVRTWVAAGGFLTPSTAVPASAYGSAADRELAARLLGSSSLVIDGSDAMPPIIGTDLFWSEITKWVTRSITYQELAATLDAARAPVALTPTTTGPSG